MGVITYSFRKYMYTLRFYMYLDCNSRSGGSLSSLTCQVLDCCNKSKVVGFSSIRKMRTCKLDSNKVVGNDD